MGLDPGPRARYSCALSLFYLSSFCLKHKAVGAERGLEIEDGSLRDMN